MFILKTEKEIELCQGCKALKTLPKTEHAPQQSLCSKPKIKNIESCEIIATNSCIHQCDNCELLGKKTDKGILYFTCYSPKNINIFGRWWKALTPHAYFCPNGLCWYKDTPTR